MPSTDHLKTLYAYHFDTTQRLIAGAQGLPDEAIKPIYDLLAHILSADRGWRVGLETLHRPPSLDRDDYPDLAALQRGFEEERAAYDGYLGGLSPDQIDQEVELHAGVRTGPRIDRVFTFVRWRVLHHVLLHGMQHHAEIAELLTQAGASPGDIDFIFYRSS